MRIEEEQFTGEGVTDEHAVYVVDPKGHRRLIKEDQRISSYCDFDPPCTTPPTTIEVQVPDLNEASFNRVREKLLASGIEEPFLKNWY